MHRMVFSPKQMQLIPRPVSWHAFIVVVGVLHGLNPTELVTQEGTPALLKRIDLLVLNNIDAYFEQLKRRIADVGDHDD